MWAVIVQVSFEPAVRPLEVQVTVPEAFAQPLEAETKLVPAASTSLSV
jgi:hypothetical protein